MFCVFFPPFSVTAVAPRLAPFYVLPFLPPNVGGKMCVWGVEDERQEDQVHFQDVGFSHPRPLRGDPVFVYAEGDLNLDFSASDSLFHCFATSTVISVTFQSGWAFFTSARLAARKLK